MLTDTEKAALVGELAEAIHAADDHNGHMHYARKHATACLPIIERLLDERDLDALLDSVGGGNMELSHYFGLWKCVLYAWVGNTREQVSGYGPTRTAAIQAAVKAAKEAGNERGV